MNYDYTKDKSYPDYSRYTEASLRVALDLALEPATEVDIDVTRIKLILDALEKYDGKIVVDVDAAWEDFLENHLNSVQLYPIDEVDLPAVKTKTVQRKPLLRIALIAASLAALIVGATATAAATGFELWGAVARWSSELFGFSTGENVPGDIKYPELSEELRPYYDALLDAGIEKPLLPTYIPEGYIQVDSQFDEDGAFWCVAYQCGDNILYFRAQKMSVDSGTRYQKDNVAPETYVVDNMTCYIMPNEGRYTGVWGYGQYEYSIMGATKEELYLMLNSISTRRN